MSRIQSKITQNSKEKENVIHFLKEKTIDRGHPQYDPDVTKNLKQIL